jgi:GT2 family glycosyltransferase
MLSVIVVSFNTIDLLGACLRSLRRFEPGAEVIVVDNGSRDGSAAMVRTQFPEVKLIEAGKNLGFAAANNLGLEASAGRILVLFNSDAELMDNSLSRCGRRLDSDPQLGAVHPRLVGADGKPQQCEHLLPTFAGHVRTSLGLPRPGPVGANRTWLAGTALVIRRVALETVGGRLDDGYFIYWEDADLSARLRAAGWGLAVEDAALVRHVGGASGGGPDSARRADLLAWYYYGMHRWFRRNRPWWEAVAVWLYEALEIPRLCLRGLRRRDRRASEWTKAGVTGRVLVRSLLCIQPAR